MDCTAHGRGSPIPHRVLPRHVSGSRWFIRALARCTATVLMMGFPKHTLSSATRTAASSITLFSDVAIRGCEFQVGVVGVRGLHCHYTCPRWITSLQQAELYTAYAAMKVAVSMHEDKHSCQLFQTCFAFSATCFAS